MVRIFKWWSVYRGSGYLISPTTTFYPFNRLYTNKIPTLSCSQSSDRFTVDASKGNGELKYPIGLITADEASMAGGVYNVVNTGCYLYTGRPYWTLTSSIFDSSDISARVFFMNSTGYLNSGSGVTNILGVRPVINLRSDVIISGGDGTAINPYIVTMVSD